MRVLFCGGGTGGHIYPALAMADIFKQNEKNTEIAFVGRLGGRENDAVLTEKYKLYEIDICGFKRSLSPQNIKTLIKALRGVGTAKKIIKEFKPDIIIGTGGYVSWPVLTAGTKLKIPTLIHESNSYPGLVTRLISHKCSAVLLNRKDAKRYLKSKRNVHVVGNPLRGDFLSLTKEAARKKLGIGKGEFFIISFGGSLGAEKINRAATEMMQSYSVKHLKIRHIHATGRSEYERLREEHPKLCSGVAKCKIVPYIENMPLYLTAADMAITRCGAMTLSELAATGTAAILIPSPNVSDNHQYKNARDFENKGAAFLIEESALTAELLMQRTKQLFENEAIRRKMSENMTSLHKKDTPEQISRIVKFVLNSSALK